eukprot:Blabericola_migrator_1__1364@NODE_1354_length_4736_cov_127_577854_g909_i0_p1_GENE_NODE_1354_length_4736_cov_127_577854_g909_i0NODE_1354_length_4736_cov_127_577854_g909_i0_p1_ORF_typecomplete_len1035_score163_51WD40/PF00400_32/0_0019WD40/PF00400_32/1_2e04WD40/PF00400_32/5e07WD40/PF00400_32/0_053WD40/PF00400_32/11ANAPC4_WD40/PF12894_7/5_1e02ANAPC4_WD40/PF12894_7/16ANAPC4_WD40/PF12894_7/3_8e05ANAPC4_WD40/PF12894_7/0_00065ANAPC4_WD40/PF12894_7/0_0021TFIID_NTD2/PF04494_15/4_7e11eIF2A/PF08662_11/5_8e0
MPPQPRAPPPRPGPAPNVSATYPPPQAPLMYDMRPPQAGQPPQHRRSPPSQQPLPMPGVQFPPPSSSTQKAAPAPGYPMILVEGGAWPNGNLLPSPSQAQSSPQPTPNKDPTNNKMDFWGLQQFAQPTTAQASPAPAPHDGQQQPIKPEASPHPASGGSGVISEDSANRNDSWRRGWTAPSQPMMKQPPPVYQQAAPPWPTAAIPKPVSESSPKLQAAFPPPAKVPSNETLAGPAPSVSSPVTSSPVISPGNALPAQSPPPAASPSPTEDMMNVARALRRHGYHQMAALVEDDVEKGAIGRSDQSAQSSGGSTERQVNGQFLSAAKWLSAKENPLANYKNFVKLYSSFWQWSVRAVDFVRQTLREICFIIFVELWCRLLSLSLKKAAAFLKRFGEAHYIHHPREISEMRRVESFEVLCDVPFVSRILRGERFHLKADNLTKKLLTTRLTMDNDTVILDILQKRLDWGTPTDSAEDPGLAVLTSNHIKSSVTKDMGSAIITPSLALLCGLHSPAPGIKSSKYGVSLTTEEPKSKPLPPNLATLYRLPRVSGGEGAGMGEPTTTATDKPGLEWRAKRNEQDRVADVLSRPKGDVMPSILALEIGGHQIRQSFAAPQRRKLAVGAVAVSKDDNASTLAMSDYTSNSIWLWDVTQAAWTAASNTYKKKLFNPWLLSYAKQKAAMAGQEGQDRNDLEPAAVTVQFDEQTYKIPESDLDAAYASLKNTDTPDDPELFAKILDNPGLQEFSYTPACLSGHQDPVTAISFLSPFLTGRQSKLAISGSYDGKMILWEVSQRIPICTYKSGSAILDLDSDRYGYLYLTGHNNKAACLWCMDRRNPLRVLNKHSSSVERVRFHPNSILLATAAADDRVRLWDPRVPDIVGLICAMRSPRCLEFAPNGRHLAISGTASSKVHIWDLIAGKLCSSIVIDPLKGQEFPTSLSFSHGSTMLAVTTTQGTLQLWDLDSSASQMNLRMGAHTPTVIDLASQDENQPFLGSLKKTHFEGCVAEYSFNNAFAKRALFTERNCLLTINEVVSRY